MVSLPYLGTTFFLLIYGHLPFGKRWASFLAYPWCRIISENKICCHLLTIQANHLQHPQLLSSKKEGRKSKYTKRKQKKNDGITTIPVNDIFFLLAYGRLPFGKRGAFFLAYLQCRIISKKKLCCHLLILQANHLQHPVN